MLSLAEGNELTGRILESFKKARSDIQDWLKLADHGYTAQRRRVLRGLIFIFSGDLIPTTIL